MSLRVWTCNTFQGHWPVGSAAVVVAAGIDDARKALGEKLSACGLALADDDELIEVPLEPGAHILCDGEY